MTGSSYKEDGLTIPRLAQAGQPCRRLCTDGGGVGMGHGDLRTFSSEFFKMPNSNLEYWYEHANFNQIDDTAIALFKIAEAIEKLADSIAKQDQDSKAVFKKELTSVSDKMDQLHQVVETAILKQDIELMKEQLGQIQGTLLALNRLIQKKESP